MLQCSEILQQDKRHRLWDYNAEKEAIKQEGHPDTQDLLYHISLMLINTDFLL